MSNCCYVITRIFCCWKTFCKWTMNPTIAFWQGSAHDMCYYQYTSWFLQSDHSTLTKLRNILVRNTVLFILIVQDLDSLLVWMEIFPVVSISPTAGPRSKPVMVSMIAEASWLSTRFLVLWDCMECLVWRLSLNLALEWTIVRKYFCYYVLIIKRNRYIAWEWNRQAATSMRASCLYCMQH